jgi:hypothetical protein
MIRSVHVGNHIGRKEDLSVIADFLEAIGLRITNRTLGEYPYLAFSGPEISFGFGVGGKELFLDIGIVDTETAYQIAKKKNIKIISDFTDGERVFRVELPGGINAVIHPESELSGLSDVFSCNISGDGKQFAIVVS